MTYLLARAHCLIGFHTGQTLYCLDCGRPVWTCIICKKEVTR